MSSRPQQQVVTLNLPIPPSVNSAFVARHGSHRTAKSGTHLFWLRCVEEEIFALTEAHTKPLPQCNGTSYGLWIDVPAIMRGDIDNRVKLLSDMLVSLKVVADDKLMRHLYVTKVHGLQKDRCNVAAVGFTAWNDYVMMRIG